MRFSAGQGLVGLLLLANAGLASWWLFGQATPGKTMSAPGLRAEWVAVEKPWTNAVDLSGVATQPAPLSAPKIDLKEGRASLDAAIETANQRVASNPLADLQCRLWGPLLQSETTRVSDALVDWSGKKTRLERQVPIGFVVFLPQEIVSSGVGVEQLSDKGVKDMFYITTPGPLQGTISLGLFRERSRATLLRDDLLRRGVDGVEIRERLGPTRVFFELTGTTTQISALNSIYELNRRGELAPCPDPGA